MSDREIQIIPSVEELIGRIHTIPKGENPADYTDIYDSARNAVDGAYKYEPLSKQIHQARMDRDWGFVAVRNSLQRPGVNFHYAEIHIKDSESGLEDSLEEHEDELNPDSKAYLISEWGASTTTLGRLLVARSVKTTLEGGDGSKDLFEGRMEFDISERRLKRAGRKVNHYYATVNSKHGERAEVLEPPKIEDGRKQKNHYHRKANFEAAASVIFDRHNTKPAFGTIIRRRKDASSLEAARDSVILRP